VRLVSDPEVKANNRKLMSEHQYHRINVYSGPGSSHSWLWLAESLERMGFFHVAFAEDGKALLRGPDVICICGGDAFRISDELGAEGRNAISRSVSSGSTYVGICAGAYLGLDSRTSPLGTIGLIKAPLANLVTEVPRNLGEPAKFQVACGARTVIHPVRGRVKVAVAGSTVEAPLYGGTIWLGQGNGQIEATYDSWTDRAVLLAERAVADNMFLDRAAMLSRSVGKGHAFLMGPHFEHPEYLEANMVLAAALTSTRFSDETRPRKEIQGRPTIGLRRSLSELRIAASGLSGLQWKIGRKVWESDKVALFVNAMWSRLEAMERSERPFHTTEGLEDELRGCVRVLRSVRKDAKQGLYTTDQARMLFDSLSSCTSDLMNSYFEWLRATSTG